jgi:putative Ca2+/H+ antiporter (TMEM165/GDT1 family)
MLAFLIVDGIAIAAGSWITTIIPIRILKIASGVIFIILGILILRKKKEDNERKTLNKNVLLSGFFLIFLTEWGDKTQIAAALFAAKYNVIMVLCGTMIALSLLSIIAVYFGKIISEKIDKKLLNRIAGVVFIIMGLIFFIP